MPHEEKELCPTRDQAHGGKERGGEHGRVISKKIGANQTWNFSFFTKWSRSPAWNPLSSRRARTLTHQSLPLQAATPATRETIAIYRLVMRLFARRYRWRIYSLGLSVRADGHRQSRITTRFADEYRSGPFMEKPCRRRRCTLGYHVTAS